MNTYFPLSSEKVSLCLNVGGGRGMLLLNVWCLLAHCASEVLMSCFFAAQAVLGQGCVSTNVPLVSE